MEINVIKKRIARGFLSLTFRKAALLAINYITINLVLARILPVSIIGIFNIANSIIAFFTFFSDIGLAAALIQKKEITQEDVRTTFTIQEILAVIIAVSIWFLAPYFAQVYSLDNPSMWLIRALAVSFLLISLKVIPSVLLERELKFHPLVLVEILETIVFNGVLIWLTLLNFQIWAFSIAVLARGLVGVISIYILAPWKAGFAFSKQSIKELLSFGLPFQFNSILALLKDRLVPLVIAKMVGSTGIGFITWATSIAFLPLEIMNIMIRVTFPAFSRLQHDKEELKRTLEDAIFITALLSYPLLFGIDAIASKLIEVIVSPKWQPALPLIYLFSIGAFWATLSSPFTNFLNATGRINITLKLMVMWTVLEWTLSPILTIYFGYLGVGLASAIISTTAIVPILIIKRIAKIDILPNIWQPVLASVIMAITVFFMGNVFINSTFSFFAVVIFGVFLYAILIFLLAKKRILGYIHNFRNV